MSNRTWNSPTKKKKEKRRLLFSLGMAIFTRSADTRPGPTLMGRILPGPFRNRVGYGFKKKKNPETGLGRVRILLKKPRPDPYKNPYKTRYPKLQKYPTIYIYSYNLTLTNPHFFNLQSSAAAAHTVRSTHTQHPTGPHSPQHPTQSLSLISAQSTQSSVRSVLFFF